MHSQESARVKNLRKGIIKAIPKFPNNKATVQALEAKSLGSLLIDYANWAIRFIARRPRTVVVEATASNDPRWTTLSDLIQGLLSKVRAGDDLTPYLSPSVHKKGFTPAASAKGPAVDRWADKDMLLNVMGYHHLHFDAAPTNTMRSDDVLFAHVTRDTFTVVGIFNHTVFEATQLNAAMTKERERLFTIFDEQSSRGLPPGSVYIPTMIATSGHSLTFTMFGMHCARIINQIDPKLDDPSYVRGLYQSAGWQMPKKPKLSWQFHALNFGLLEGQGPRFILLRAGPN